MNDVTVEPLTPDRLPDFLRFFDGPAFSDNPAWASCYCQCFYEDHRVICWADRTGAQNRAAATERVGQRAMQGYLAYLDGVPIGWCNAAPRPLLHALDDEPIDDAAAAGSIVCFLVDPRHRGRGVARRLLDAACEGLKAQGLRVVDANPRTGPASAAANHHGPLSMYLSSGFAVLREVDDGSVWVRRAL